MTLDSNYKPSAIAIHMTDEALSGLPTEGKETVLALPAEAESYGLPFDHVTLDWNPRGHEPDFIYGAPHFDMHFYVISQAERNTITPGTPAAARMPEAAAVPAGYVPPPDPANSVVPQMGMHWSSPSTSLEFTPAGFSRTLIYGFAHGKLAFVEPMITRDYLLSRTNSAATFTVPDLVAKHGYYPSRYRIEHNEDRSIDIILDQFVVR